MACLYKLGVYYILAVKLGRPSNKLMPKIGWDIQLT